MFCVLGPVLNAHLFLSTNYKVGISIIPNFRLKYLGTDRLKVPCQRASGRVKILT